MLQCGSYRPFYDPRPFCNLQTVTKWLNAAFVFFFQSKVRSQWYYYFPMKAAGKLRWRQNRGDTTEKPQVTFETGPPGILVVPEEAVKTTPPLCSEGQTQLQV